MKRVKRIATSALCITLCVLLNINPVDYLAEAALESDWLSTLGIFNENVLYVLSQRMDTAYAAAAPATPTSVTVSNFPSTIAVTNTENNSLSVSVANTSIPVTGNVGVSGTVGLSAGTSVGVSGTVNIGNTPTVSVQGWTTFMEYVDGLEDGNTAIQAAISTLDTNNTASVQSLIDAISALETATGNGDAALQSALSEIKQWLTDDLKRLLIGNGSSGDSIAQIQQNQTDRLMMALLGTTESNDPNVSLRQEIVNVQNALLGENHAQGANLYSLINNSLGYSGTENLSTDMDTVISQLEEINDRLNNMSHVYRVATVRSWNQMMKNALWYPTSDEIPYLKALPYTIRFSYINSAGQTVYTGGYANVDWSYWDTGADSLYNRSHTENVNAVTIDRNELVNLPSDGTNPLSSRPSSIVSGTFGIPDPNIDNNLFSSDEARALKILGYDTILEAEGWYEYHASNQNATDTMFTYDQLFIDRDRVTYSDFFQVMYKALGQYNYSYSYAVMPDTTMGCEISKATYNSYSDAEKSLCVLIDENTYWKPSENSFNSPLAQGLSNLNGLDFSKGNLNLFVSRSNKITGRIDAGGETEYQYENYYWDKALKDGFATQNQDPLAYIKGEDFVRLAVDMMHLYGEPVMNQDEVDALLQIYGIDYPVQMGIEFGDKWAYLKVRGVLNEDIDYYGCVSRSQLLNLAMCVKDKDSRSDYKEVQLTLDIGDLMISEGYYPVEDLNVTFNGPEANIQIDYEASKYYDYFLARSTNKISGTNAAPIFVRTADNTLASTFYIMADPNNPEAGALDDATIRVYEDTVGNIFYHLKVPKTHTGDIVISTNEECNIDKITIESGNLGGGVYVSYYTDNDREVKVSSSGYRTFNQMAYGINQDQNTVYPNWYKFVDWQRSGATQPSGVTPTNETTVLQFAKILWDKWTTPMVAEAASYNRQGVKLIFDFKTIHSDQQELNEAEAQISEYAQSVVEQVGNTTASALTSALSNLPDLPHNSVNAVQSMLAENADGSPVSVRTNPETGETEAGITATTSDGEEVFVPIDLTESGVDASNEEDVNKYLNDLFVKGFTMWTLDQSLLNTNNSSDIPTPTLTSLKGTSDYITNSDFADYVCKVLNYWDYNTTNGELASSDTFTRLFQNIQGSSSSDGSTRYECQFLSTLSEDKHELVNLYGYGYFFDTKQINNNNNSSYASSVVITNPENFRNAYLGATPGTPLYQAILNNYYLMAILKDNKNYTNVATVDNLKLYESRTISASIGFGDNKKYTYNPRSGIPQDRSYLHDKGYLEITGDGGHHIRWLKPVRNTYARALLFMDWDEIPGYAAVTESGIFNKSSAYTYLQDNPNFKAVIKNNFCKEVENASKLFINTGITSIECTNLESCKWEIGFDTEEHANEFLRKLDGCNLRIDEELSSDRPGSDNYFTNNTDLRCNVQNSAIMSRNENILISWNELVSAGLFIDTFGGQQPQPNESDGIYYLQSFQGIVKVSNQNKTILIGNTFYNLQDVDSSGQVTGPCIVHEDEDTHTVYFDYRCVMGLNTNGLVVDPNTKCPEYSVRSTGVGKGVIYNLTSSGVTSDTASFASITTTNYPSIYDTTGAYPANINTGYISNILLSSAWDNSTYVNRQNESDTLAYWPTDQGTNNGIIRMPLSSFCPTANWVIVIRQDNQGTWARLYVWYIRNAFTNSKNGDGISMDVEDNRNGNYSNDIAAAPKYGGNDLAGQVTKIQTPTSSLMQSTQWYDEMTKEAIYNLWMDTNGGFVLGNDYTVRMFDISTNSAYSCDNPYNVYKSRDISSEQQEGDEDYIDPSLIGTVKHLTGNDVGAIYWLEGVGFVYNVPYLYNYNHLDYLEGRLPLPIAYCEKSSTFSSVNSIVNFNIDYYGTISKNFGDPDASVNGYGYTLGTGGLYNVFNVSSGNASGLAGLNSKLGIVWENSEVPGYTQYAEATGKTYSEWPYKLEDTVFAPAGYYAFFGGADHEYILSDRLNASITQINKIYLGSQRIQYNTEKSMTTPLYNRGWSNSEPAALPSGVKFYRVQQTKQGIDYFIATDANLTALQGGSIKEVEISSYYTSNDRTWLDKLGLTSLLKSIDDGASLFILIAFNVLPMIGLIIMTILIGLSFITDMPMVQQLSDKFIDPVKILTFGGRTVHTWTWRKSLLPCIILFVVFGMVCNGNIIRVVQFILTMWGTLQKMWTGMF